MKLPWDKNYIKISFHVIVTILIIYSIGMFITFFGNIMCFVQELFSKIIKLLSPLIIGLIIAYIIDPLVEYYENLLTNFKMPIELFKKKKKQINLNHSNRKLATFLSYSTIILFMSLFIIIIVNSIYNQVKEENINDKLVVITNYFNSFKEVPNNIQNTLDKYNIEGIKLDKYFNTFSTKLLTTISNIIEAIIIFFSNLTGHLINISLGLVISIYLILDKQKFLKWWNTILQVFLSKKSNRIIHHFWHDLDNILSGFIRGQFLDAIIMSFLISILLSIVGIKFSVIIGITAGLANLIPYFGPLVADVGAVGIAFITGNPIKALYALIALSILQQIDGSIIGPKLIGDSVKLHPVLVLLSVVIGSTLYGLLGMLFAVPFTALIILFIRRIIDSRIQNENKIESN